MATEKTRQSTEAEPANRGLFTFDYRRAMVYEQTTLSENPSRDGLHPSHSMGVTNKEKLGAEAGDTLLVLSSANGYSTLYTVPLRVDGTSVKWTLSTERQPQLDLSAGDRVHSWVTVADKIGEYTDLQQRIGSQDTVAATGDPTNGTWLYIRDLTLSRRESVSDSVSGKVHIYTDPYLEYLPLETIAAANRSVLARVGHDGNYRQFKTQLTNGGSSFTIQKSEREPFGLSPGDTVSIWLHTGSIAARATDKLSVEQILADYHRSATIASVSQPESELSDAQTEVESDSPSASESPESHGDHEQTDSQADQAQSPESASTAPVNPDIDSSQDRTRSAVGGSVVTDDTDATALDSAPLLVVRADRSARQQDWVSHLYDQAADALVCGCEYNTLIQQADGDVGDVLCLDCLASVNLATLPDQTTAAVLTQLLNTVDSSDGVDSCGRYTLSDTGEIVFDTREDFLTYTQALLIENPR